MIIQKSRFTDVDEMQAFWKVFPNLRRALFEPGRKGYSNLNVAKDEIKDTIFAHPEFVGFREEMDGLFHDWKEEITARLKALTPGFHPKERVLVETFCEGVPVIQ